MRSVLVAMVGALGGCDATFQLDKVVLPDAPDAPTSVDHDGDGFFADDNCPAIASIDLLDEDGDGVGNACDPHPGEHDEVVVQELFDGAAEPWSAIGEWTRAVGAWTSPPALEGGVFALTAPRALYRPAIQVGFTLDHFNAASPQRELVIQLDAPALRGDCAIRQDENTTGKSHVVLHVGTDIDGTYVTPIYAPGTRYLATYKRALTSSCSILATTHTTPDMLEELTTAPALTIKKMQVTLHHVTVYQVIR